MKYAVGDYICREDTILLKVVMAYAEGTAPIYGLLTHRHEKMQWFTEHELESYTKTEPNIQRWATVEAGDVIHVGKSAERAYIRVLARIDNSVLLSEAPLAQKQKDKLDALASQIEELSQGEVTKKSIMDTVPSTSTIEAHKSASHWMSVEHLALMNWELLRE